MKYKYETHLHTCPVSKCAAPYADVLTNLKFYKEQGYDGVFITNHFLDGNVNIDRDTPYEEKIHFYFSDYEKALELSKEVGIKVFLGVEVSYLGTDFLVYGLDKEWFLKNPQIMDMKKSEELPYFIENGALVIQAHPFQKNKKVDHIRLYPNCVHGVEIINAGRGDLTNGMAQKYCEHYDLIPFAGSDNHSAGTPLGGKPKRLAGMYSDEPIVDEQDFVDKVKNRKMQVFDITLEEREG